MKDMIPKGTGNSRYLRSVSNFKAIYPTYDDFVNALVAGNLPVDFNGINEAGIQQVGTSLNKANLLTDEVARQVGLRTADPTPNDMFNVLANVGNLHVWERVQTYSEPVPEVPAGYTLGEVETDTLIVTGTSSTRYIYFYTATSPTVDNNGNVSIPTTTTQSSYKVSVLGDSGKTLNGPFFFVLSSDTVGIVVSEVVYIPAGATMYCDSSYTKVYISKLQRVTGYPYTPAIPAGTHTDYLTSTDRDAYTDGTVDSTTITYLGQLGGGARIEVGTYVGTGTYNDKNNPSSITFGFAPKFLEILGYYSTTNSDASNIVKVSGFGNRVFLKDCPSTFTQRFGLNDNTTHSAAYKTYGRLNGKLYEWYLYGSSSASEQYNKSGLIYYYLCIG